MIDQDIRFGYGVILTQEEWEDVLHSVEDIDEGALADKIWDSDYTCCINQWADESDYFLGASKVLGDDIYTFSSLEELDKLIPTSEIEGFTNFLDEKRIFFEKNKEIFQNKKLEYHIFTHTY